MFRGPWTLPAAERRRASLAGEPMRPRKPKGAAPTEKDDGAHASEPEFAQDPNRDWYAEWWYFNVRDPKTGIALLGVYSASPYGSPNGCAVFEALAFTNDGPPVHAEAHFSYDGQVRTSPDRADVAFGADYRIEAKSAHEYTIVASDPRQKIEWEITLTRVDGADPAWLLHDARGPLAGSVGYWMAWMPFARAHGWVKIDGKRYELNDASAYHDHNWGVWLAPACNWQWLQCSSVGEGIALDLGYSDGFDPPRVAVLCVDGRTFAFEADGIELPTYTQFSYWPDTTWKYPKSATTTLVDRTGTCRVEVEWKAKASTPLATMIALFEQHVEVTLRVSKKNDGDWRAERSYEVDGIAEWSDSYVEAWQTGEGMIGGYVAEATVFGGGIAGLTAAHELVERGFVVTVVEPEEALDARGERTMAIGGMARSHYARVPRLGPAPIDRPAGRPTPDARDDRWRARTVTFGLDSYEPPVDVDGLAREAARAFDERYLGEGYHLRVVGGASPVEKDPRALAARRADAVVERLVAHEIARERIVVLHRVDSAPTVTITLDDHVLPGEHGFRFFPSYYRHVTDTMARIPVYDRDGRMTDRRVIDNLKPSTRGLTLRSGRHPTLGLRGAASPLQALRMLVQAVDDDDYDPRDFLQMGIRMMRYLATCPERREPLGDMSWWNYLCGFSPRTRCYLYRYSDSFSRDAVASGRVLAAFDWRWGDARTNGSTFVQLAAPVPGTSPSSFDGMLDGPTTEAWFVHWRKFLGECGVRFVAASLEALKVETNAAGREVVVPYVTKHGGPPEPWRTRSREPHYVVCATDAPAAEHVSRHLAGVGVVERLRGYTTTYGDETRDPYTQPGLGKNDRFQTLTGIQYFFEQSFSIGEGAYSIDAPWSLTTVSVQRLWKNRPFAAKDGFAGMLTVDIGDFRVKAGPAQRTAWDSSLERIGEQVWTQLTEDLRMAPEGRSPMRLPRPRWFHLDDNIEFDERAPWTVKKNRAPYLVPILADWRNRPGPAPFDPNVPQATAAPAHPQAHVWTAPHGGYPVHWGTLVYAGVYLKTFTRMTTMESANESARHAVNAILDHYNAHHATTVPPPSAPTPARAEPLEIEADEVLPEFLGDYAGIWNMERYEPPSFDALKALDQVLFDLGLPHLFDLLGVEVVPSLLSHLFPYRGDCAPWKVPPPKVHPKPAWYCPPFVGEGVGRAIGKVRSLLRRKAE